MAVEYNGDKIVLRDSSGNQMSVPRFFQLAIRNEAGTHQAQPSSGLYRNDSTEFHGAWDMGTAGASDVVARTPASGTVVFVGGAGGFGPNLVIIKEDDYERYHYFGHMASAAVQQGDIVQQGDKVGIVGGYGGSAGSWNPNAYAIHLHYEVMTKNIMVSGGTSHDKEFVLDPMDVFDESTLPSGWIYGYNPQTKPTNYAAKAYNWDYIELDKTATDFGPPGGEIPSEPFMTDSRCYDISHPQKNDITGCIDAIIAAGGGGIIFGGGKIQNKGFVDWATVYPTYKADEAMTYAKGKIPMGVYFYNYADFGTDTKQAVADAVAYLTNAGLKPADFPLGAWLDIDSEGGGESNDPELSLDVDTNMVNVKDFIDGFTEAGFATAGIYTTAGILKSGKFSCDYSHNIPIWCAFIGEYSGDISFEDAGINRIAEAYPAIKNYSNVYLHQYTWVERVPNWNSNLDGDKVCQPIPTSGNGGGGDGGGGGSTTEVIKITVDVIPPKRIYFSPVPGVITADSVLLNKRTATITISTDADNADLYYTIDGSSPYQYTYDGDIMVYALAANANKYTNSITIHKDTHIRVIAVPAGTAPGGDFDKPLAKGSGTYLFSYHNVIQDWEAERKSYAISDNNTSFFEENKQAFLRLHDSQTPEEVLYAAVYRHNTQSQAEDAKDNASTTGETQPDSNPLSDGTTDEGGSDNVSDE